MIENTRLKNIVLLLGGLNIWLTYMCDDFKFLLKLWEIEGVLFSCVCVCVYG